MIRILGIICIVLAILLILAGTTIGILSKSLFEKSVKLRIVKKESALKIAKLKMLREIEIMLLSGMKDKDIMLNKIRSAYEKITADNLDSYLDDLMDLQDGGGKSGTNKGETGNSD